MLQNRFVPLGQTALGSRHLPHISNDSKISAVLVCLGSTREARALSPQPCESGGSLRTRPPRSQRSGVILEPSPFAFRETLAGIAGECESDEHATMAADYLDRRTGFHDRPPNGLLHAESVYELPDVELSELDVVRGMRQAAATRANASSTFALGRRTVRTRPGQWTGIEARSGWPASLPARRHHSGLRWNSSALRKSVPWPSSASGSITTGFRTPRSKWPPRRPTSLRPWQPFRMPSRPVGSPRSIR